MFLHSCQTNFSIKFWHTLYENLTIFFSTVHKIIFFFFFQFFYDRNSSIHTKILFFFIFSKIEISKISLYLPKTEISKNIFIYLSRNNLVYHFYPKNISHFYLSRGSIFPYFIFLSQVAIVFHILRDFYIVCNHNDAFCFCLLQKDLDTFHKLFLILSLFW